MPGKTFFAPTISRFMTSCVAAAWVEETEKPPAGVAFLLLVRHPDSFDQAAA